MSNIFSLVKLRSKLHFTECVLSFYFCNRPHLKSTHGSDGKVGHLFCEIALPTLVSKYILCHCWTFLVRYKLCVIAQEVYLVFHADETPFSFANSEIQIIFVAAGDDYRYALGRKFPFFLKLLVSFFLCPELCRYSTRLETGTINASWYFFSLSHLFLKIYFSSLVVTSIVRAL